MEQNHTERANTLINAIKENLLKPMYDGIIRDNNDTKNEIVEKLKCLESKIFELKQQQDAFIDAIKNIKWDDSL